MMQEQVFLSLMPADRTDRRLAFGVAAASLAIFAAIAPFAKIPLARIDAFIPIYQSGVLINDLITAVLLYGQFSIVRSRALLLLASGYLFTALMVVAHTLSFPGLFAPGGLLGSGPQTTAWLYMFWHGGFPLAVIAYALLKGRQDDPIITMSNRSIILASITGVAGIAIGLTQLATSGHGLLPVIMSGNVMAPALLKVIWGILILGLIALLTLMWKRRPYSLLDIWLMVVSFVWLGDIALSAMLNAARFDLGFYAGRAYGFLAASFVLMVLLLENAKLYTQLARSHASLTVAKAQLDAYAHGLEGQVRASEEKYRLFMEQARDGILALDLTGVIVEANRETETLLRRRREDIIGKPFIDFLVDADLPETQDKINGLLATTSSRATNLIATQDGDLQLDIVSSRVQVGNQSRILIIARDVTERRKLEQQLRQAQKMEAIGQLTGGLAHDFNNLLAVVVGNLDLLTDQLKDGESQEYAKTALDAALRGAELTRQLLAFSRKQPLQARRCDVNELVADMLKLLRRTLGEQIDIVFNPGPDLPMVMIDPAQFGSVIANLATNARDAMPQGGRLTFATQHAVLDEDYVGINPDVVPGDYVMLVVSDTGTGIPAENLARVFDPFFTTKPAGQGTGLGLSMVFGFVKQSGGHIKMYSEMGRGTVVRIYLPPATGHGHKDNMLVDAASSDQAGGETILVVDDNANVRQIAAKQLTNLGYQILEAETPGAALEYLRDGVKVDLLFTDIVMPGGMSGRELAHAAKTLQPGLKVLYTSGFLGTSMPESTQLQPDDAFLGKPYRQSELAKKIRDVLGRA